MAPEAVESKTEITHSMAQEEVVEPQSTHEIIKQLVDQNCDDLIDEFIKEVLVQKGNQSLA